MADETSQDQTPDRDGGATPNRDRRHEPPIIEGEFAAPEEGVDALSAAAIEAPAEDVELSQPPVEEAPASPPAVKSSRPLLSAAIGAALGAAVAGAGVWFSDQRPVVDPDVSGRLASLEKGAPAASAALVALDRRVGALEAASNNARDKTSGDAVGQRIAALEAAALSAKATADENKGARAEADAARADASKALALASAATQNASGAATHAAPSDDATAVASGALASRVEKLEAALATVDHPSVDLNPVNQRLDKLDAALAAPKSETRVPAEAVAPSRDWAGVAVVVQALSARLGAGAPFTLEMAALEHLGADPAKLSTLKPLAEKGVTTATTLAADFAKVSPAILAASSAKTADGVVDRLLANMSKVVKVTPVGEVAGDDPAALVSQIGAALDRGKIAAAVAAWSRLPEAARRASQQWASTAQSRLDADAAAQAILDEAMTRLAAAKN